MSTVNLTLPGSFSTSGVASGSAAGSVECTGAALATAVVGVLLVFAASSVRWVAAYQTPPTTATMTSGGKIRLVQR